MGAWIEIDMECESLVVGESLPVWERGLNFFLYPEGPGAIEVAPRVGAWIEIFILSASSFYSSSLPVWERGLKWEKA